MGLQDHRDPGRGHRDPGPGVRHQSAVGHPHRRRHRTQRRRRSGGAVDRLPPRPGRRLAPCRRRDPAAPPLGLSAEVGRALTDPTSSGPAPASSTSSSWVRPLPASSGSTRRSRRCSSTTPTRSQCPRPGRTLAGLAREDLFTVVSEQFLTDTADYADIVLPATTQLEQFDIMFSWGHLYLSLNKPAIEPLGEAVSQRGDVPPAGRAHGPRRRLVRLPTRRWPMAALDWSAPASTGITLESAQGEGLGPAQSARPRPLRPPRRGRLPDRVGQVRVQLVAGRAGGQPGRPRVPRGLQRVPAGRHVDPLPHYVPPPEDVDGLPLPAVLHVAQVARLPQLAVRQHGLPAAGAGRAVGDHAPDDAEARGIEEGQPVRVFNERGELQAVARIGAGDQVARGVVVSRSATGVSSTPAAPPRTPSPAPPSPTSATPPRSPTPGSTSRRSTSAEPLVAAAAAPQLRRTPSPLGPGHSILAAQRRS